MASQQGSQQDEKPDILSLRDQAVPLLRVSGAYFDTLAQVTRSKKYLWDAPLAMFLIDLEPAIAGSQGRLRRHS